VTTARRWQILAGFGVLLAGFAILLGRNHTIPERALFDDFPRELGEYTSRRIAVSNDALRMLDLTDYLSRNYSNASRTINLYVGYHGYQRQGSTIHSPSHCLPANGWSILDRQRVPLLGQPGAPLVNRMVVGDGENRQLVYYWYQGRGRILDDEFMAVLYRSTDVALLNRSDEALVRFTIGDDEPDSEQELLRFMELVVPLLDPYVPA
jgi:EpsI family protein